MYLLRIYDTGCIVQFFFFCMISLYILPNQRRVNLLVPYNFFALNLPVFTQLTTFWEGQKVTLPVSKLIFLV